MEITKNKAELRREQIINLLNSRETVTVQEFCEALNCSVSTIRNDLTLMEKNGLLIRVFGGATKAASRPIPDMASRNALNLEEKKEIASYVAKHLLYPNATIILDAGTTCVKIAEAIVAADLPLTVLTASLPALNILSASEQINIYSFGGHFNRKRFAFFDDYVSALSSVYHADMLFMGVDGVHPERGVTITADEDLSSKQAFIRMASHVYAVADHTKLGRISFRNVDCGGASLSIVTDQKAAEDVCHAFAAKHIEILMK